MDILSFVASNISIVYAIAIVVTILALAISTRYSLRNLFNIRTPSVDEAASETSEARGREEACDATGNDGDDEAEEDEVEVEGSQFTGKPLSPRYPDPVDYCEHIQGEIKRVKQKVASKTIESELTDDQLNQEREIQRQQLAEIFSLMQEQQERFGINTMDDMQEQMKLYAV